jgi:hypothetical protein
MTEYFETDADYELFMPFIVVESQGGPFPDEAFVVGYELGLLDQELQTLANVGPTRGTPAGRYVHTTGLPQADLVAMRNGYTIDTSEGQSDSTWTWIEFRPEAHDGG